MNSTWLLVKKSILHNKIRTFFSILSISLAIVIIVSINISISSIKNDLVNNFDSRSMGADIIVKTGTSNIDESKLTSLEKDKNISSIHPRLTTWVLYKKNDNKLWLQLLGVDISKEKYSQNIKLIKGNLPQMSEIIISNYLSEKANLNIGDTIITKTDNGDLSFKVSGIIDDTRIGKENAGNIILTSINTFQKLMNINNYSELYISLDNKANPIDEQKSLQSTLGDGFSVYLPQDKSEESIKTLNNLFLGFNIFAFLSLFIGIFLINNTMNTVVLNSSREISIMKAFGYVKYNIFKWILSQALIYGVIGSMLGLFFGIILSNSMFSLIKTTVGTSSTTVIISWPKVVLLSLFGVVTSVLGVLGPLIRACRITVLEGFQVHSFKNTLNFKKSLKYVLFTTLLIIIFIVFNIKHLPFSEYVVFILAIVDVYFILSMLVLPMSKAMCNLIEFLSPLSSHIAFLNISNSIQRAVNTIFVIIVCTAMSIGLYETIGSFKNSMTSQITSIYTGDFLIHAPFGLKEDKLRAIKNLQEVNSVTPIYSKNLLSEKKNILLKGIDLTISKLPLAGKEESKINTELLNSNSVVISKTLAYKFNKKIGDVFYLPTEGGSLNMKIVGFSKTPDQNGEEVYISSKNFNSLFPNSYAEEYLLNFTNTNNIENISKNIQHIINDDSVTTERIDTYIKDAKKDLNSMFSIFYFLVGITFLVCSLVIINSMTMTIREMKYQVSLLKSQGATKLQLLRIMTTIGFIYGIIGSCFGGALGVFINYSLIKLAKNIMGLELDFYMNFNYTLIILLVNMLISIMSSVPPALNSYKVNIVKTLRKGEFQI